MAPVDGATVLVGRPMNRIHHARRRGPRPDRRRALELLAASPDGYTEALMLAHGFPVPLLVDLCIAGLAIATPERMVAGGRPVEVVRMKITEAGGRQSTQGGEWQVNGNTIIFARPMSTSGLRKATSAAKSA